MTSKSVAVSLTLGLLLALLGDVMTTQLASKCLVDLFALEPIGIVMNSDSATTITIDTAFRNGLVGLEHFSQLWGFYWFDWNDTRAKRKTLQVHPRGNPNLPLTGVFTTRAPERPNLIALTLCKILAI